MFFFFKFRFIFSIKWSDFCPLIKPESLWQFSPQSCSHQPECLHLSTKMKVINWLHKELFCPVTQVYWLLLELFLVFFFRSSCSKTNNFIWGSVPYKQKDVHNSVYVPQSRWYSLVQAGWVTHKIRSTGSHHRASRNAWPFQGIQLKVSQVLALF